MLPTNTGDNREGPGGEAEAGSSLDILSLRSLHPMPIILLPHAQSKQNFLYAPHCHTDGEARWAFLISGC